MQAIRFLGASIVALAAIAVVCLFFNSLNLGLYKTFAPKYESVRRQTFEQSQAHVEGMTRELENIRAEYLDPSKTPEQRAALRATAIEQFSVFPTDEMPVDLQTFYNQIEAPQ